MSGGAASRLARIPPALQARVLHEALPYVQGVQAKVFVVQCDGHWLSDATLRTGFGRDVALLHLVGLRLVLVHGDRHDTPIELIYLHRELLGVINQQGCRAVGLTCTDGGEGGPAGGLIQRLHARGFIPVMHATADGPTAEALAGQLAQHLGAEKLLLLGDSLGVLGRDGRLMPTLSARDVGAGLDLQATPAAMRERLGVALDAVAKGVRSAHIFDGRNDHALLLAVLSNAGEGTIILAEQGPHFLDDSLNYLRGPKSPAAEGAADAARMQAWRQRNIVNSG